MTIPERVGDTAATGCTVIFETVIDDYAEIWVNGSQPLALGDSGGYVAGGFNAPNRVVLTEDARPGQRFAIAVFGMNGPVSAAPANYIWMRSATLDAARSGSSSSNAAKPAPPTPPGRFPPRARPPRTQPSRAGAARNQWRQPSADRTTFRPSGTRFRPGGTRHVHPQRIGTPPPAGAAAGRGTAHTKPRAPYSLPGALVSDMAYRSCR